MDGYFSLQRFSDPDEHAGSLANFDQDYIQIEQGPFHSTLLQADLGGLHFFAESANRRIVENARASQRPSDRTVSGENWRMGAANTNPRALSCGMSSCATLSA